MIIGNPITLGGGGGLTDSDAVLRVQAPAGSTVTISKGSTTKTDLGHANADDPSIYDYYFIIHQSQFDSVNPWTVTATKDIGEDSETVIIDDNVEYDVSLNPLLPAEYQPVEYLQSSGTQYINTGVSIPSANAAIEISGKYSYTVAQASASIFGCQDNTRISPFFWLAAQQQINALGGVNSPALASNLSFSWATPNTFDFSFESGTFALTWNGSNYSGSYTQNFPTGLEMYLFRNNFTTPQLTKANVYYWNIYINGTKQREFYPCYRKADSVAGLFDKVSQSFFANAGTGSFVVGGDI